MQGSRRGLVKLGLAWNVIAWGLVILVILNAGVLGEVVLIAESDVWVMFIGAIGGVVLTLLMAGTLLRGSPGSERPKPPRQPNERW